MSPLNTLKYSQPIEPILVLASHLLNEYLYIIYLIFSCLTTRTIKDQMFKKICEMSPQFQNKSKPNFKPSKIYLVHSWNISHH